MPACASLPAGSSAFVTRIVPIDLDFVPSRFCAKTRRGKAAAHQRGMDACGFRLLDQAGSRRIGEVDRPAKFRRISSRHWVFKGTGCGFSRATGKNNLQCNYGTDSFRPQPKCIWPVLYSA
jgi:hypothetical protein